PWDPTIQETMKEVKLILHMWIGLFYTKSSEMLQTSIRQVQEHCGTPKPAAEDLHTEPAAVGQPAFSGSGSESAASEKQQSAEVVISSVIKRIEKKSNLVTSCAGRAPFYSETAPCATSRTDADHPLDGESEINNDNTQDPESLGSSGGLAECAHISSGKEREQEPKNNVHAAGLELENQEPSLSPRITDDRNMTDLMQCNDVQDTAPGNLAERSLVDSSQTVNRENASVIKQTDNIHQHTLDDSEATESESPLSQPSICTASVVEKPKSADNDDNPELEAREVEIMRQSSVIKEMLGIRLPAKDPAQSTASTNLRNATASPSCKEVNNHSENRLQTEQFDNLAASENTTNTEDLGTIKDTLAIERSVPQNTFNGVDRTDTAPQSSPLTIDVPSHTSTLNSSESCNIIIPNYNQTLDSSKTLHNIAGAPVKERTCSSVESCANDQLLRDVIETQRRRVSVRRLVSEREITSNSDSECLGDVKSLSPSDESRRQLKPQAIFNQNCACNLKAQQKQKECDRSKDFIATSERSDCGLTESPFTVRDFSESLDIKIKTATRDFSGSKKVSRISCNASSQKIKRKRNMHGEESEDRDSEDGDFRVKRNSQSGPWHMRNVDVNHSAHILEEETSDSDAPVPRTIKIPDLFGRPKVYQNFTVTAEMRQKSDEAARCRRITRTFCNWHEESTAVQHSGECNWNANYCRNTSPVEKILNLEYINFSRDLKNVVNRANVGLFTSPISYSKDGNKTALRRRNIQMVSSERLTGRGNPLTVTISCQKVEHSNGKRLHNKTWPPHWTNGEDEAWETETVTFSKPKCYTNFIKSHKRPCGQSHAMIHDSAEPADRMPRKSCCIRDKGSLLHDELLNAKRKEYKELQGDGRKRTDPFLCLITELCSNLHQNLREVVKESWKGTFNFYVFETNSDPFFKEIK
ncbi:uncharacterized protein LOC109913621, partial [Rhincodon typus]|uniref:uncharacterized protein LOC109913621 n=1 Tax=Rhincodon typus TaxID=259920 RepID=UPI00202F3983